MAASLRNVSFVCDNCLMRLRPAPQLQPCRLIRNATPARYVSSQSKHMSRSTWSTTSTRQCPPPKNSPLRRGYATTRIPPSEADHAVVGLQHRRLIKLSGDEAPKFLQGMITNNVDPTKSDSFYSAFLDARGRVLWDVFIWVPKGLMTRAEDKWACYIEIDGGEVDPLMRHLKRHKLRSKVNIQPVDPQELQVHALWADRGIDDKRLSRFAQESIAFMEDPRAEGMGYRFLGSVEEGEQAEGPGVDQYHLRRYLFGIPEGPVEIPREGALPMESNIDLSNGIDFKKGCYVGQELTIRTKHTGVVRKRVLPVQLLRDGEDVSSDSTKSAAPKYNPDWRVGASSDLDASDIPPQVKIKPLEEGKVRPRARDTGKFLAGIGNVGLALCRLESMTPMRISSEGGTWKPGMEFALDLESVEAEGGFAETKELVRVKPFVPEWLRERERALWEKGRVSKK